MDRRGTLHLFLVSIRPMLIAPRKQEEDNRQDPVTMKARWPLNIYGRWTQLLPVVHPCGLILRLRYCGEPTEQRFSMTHQVYMLTPKSAEPF